MRESCAFMCMVHVKKVRVIYSRQFKVVCKESFRSRVRQQVSSDSGCSVYFACLLCRFALSVLLEAQL